MSTKRTAQQPGGGKRIRKEAVDRFFEGAASVDDDVPENGEDEDEREEGTPTLGGFIVPDGEGGEGEEGEGHGMVVPSFEPPPVPGYMEEPPPVLDDSEGESSGEEAERVIEASAESFSTMSDDDLLAAFNGILSQMRTPEGGEGDVGEDESDDGLGGEMEKVGRGDMLQHARAVLLQDIEDEGADLTNVPMNVVKERFYEQLDIFRVLYNEMRARNFVNQMGVGGTQNLNGLNQIKNIMTMSYALLEMEHRLRSVIMGRNVMPLVSDPVALMSGPTLETGEATELKPVAILTLAILDDVRKMNLRRKGDAYYEQIMNSTGIPTHAWRREGTIQELVFTLTRREMYRARWEKLMEGNRPNVYAKEIAKFLEVCDDSDFPKLEISRNYHSFENGVYDIDKDTFMEYGDPSLTADIVAVQFHPVPMNLELFGPEYMECTDAEEARMEPFMRSFMEPHQKKAWWIPTRHLDSLWQVQGLDEEVAMWLMTLGFGRMLYDLGTHDNWHCAVVLLGMPGSGKSTMGNAVFSLFPRNEVRMLNMKCEEKFCLANIHDGLVWGCFELRRKGWNMPQDLFLQVLEGASNMTIQEKFKTAFTKTKRWTAPALLIGNELPSEWPEAVYRRIAPFRFDIKPTTQNPELAEDLAREIPYFLVKANRLYRGKAQMHKKEEIRDKLPAYCRDLIESYTKRTIHLLRMIEKSIESGTVRIEKGAYMDYRKFTALYDQWMKSNNSRDVEPLDAMDANDKKRYFAKHGCVIKEFTRDDGVIYNGRTLHGTYIFGMKDGSMDDMEARPRSGGGGGGGGGGDDVDFGGFA